MTITKLAKVGGYVQLPMTDKIAADHIAHLEHQNAAGDPHQYHAVKADKLLRAMRKTGHSLLTLREEDEGDNINSARFVLVADDATVNQLYSVL